MRIQDGWLLGRGVADDKGPMVATLYALKFLKEEGVSLRYPIRALEMCIRDRPSCGGIPGRALHLPLHQSLQRAHSRSEEHTSELQSHSDLVCRLLLYPGRGVPCLQR